MMWDPKPCSDTYYSGTKDGTILKIENHIVIIGYNDGIVHLVHSIRKKTDMPIVFFCNEDIQVDIIKLNHLYGSKSIKHFWGDPLNVDHLKTASIRNSYAVIVLYHHDDHPHHMIEDSFALKWVKMAEQFFSFRRLIVEMADQQYSFIAGYAP